MRTDQREAEAKKCKKNIRPAHVTPTQRCQCQLQRSMPIATHAETRYAPKGCKVLACPLWATFAHCCTGQVGPERVDRVQDTCPLGRSRRIRVKHAATCSAIRLCTYSADRLQHLAFSLKLYKSGDPKQKKQKKKKKGNILQTLGMLSRATLPLSTQYGSIKFSLSSYITLYEVLIVPSLTPVFSAILAGSKSEPNKIADM